MTSTEQPQIYLITPNQIELSSYPNILNRVLDVTDVACMRLSLATRDEDRIARSADVLRALCHERDIPLVIDTHVLLVERLGLDGVHLTDAARSVRKTRKMLGADAIVGAFCGNSRHDGLTAGESGADYVCFGPVGQTPLGDGSRAEKDLFDWWSEMIEIPVVAEGALDTELIAALSPVADFFAIGEEIWNTEKPEEEFRRLIKAIQ